MTDVRRKQIQKASSENVIYDDFLQKNYLNTCLNNFIAGAEWADANPQDKIARRTRLSEFRKEIDQLQSERNTLVEALKLYSGIAGHDCNKSATKWSAADIALKAIGEGE